MNNLSFYKDLYKKASDYLVENGLNPLPSITLNIIWMRTNRILGQVRSRWEGEKLVPEVLTMNARFENSDESKRIETLMHEIAHVYCIHYYNEPGHTPLFNRIAKSLGAVGGKFQQVDKIESAMQNREEYSEVRKPDSFRT
jgi:hypothetical protein